MLTAFPSWLEEAPYGNTHTRLGQAKILGTDINFSPSQCLQQRSKTNEKMLWDIANSMEDGYIMKNSHKEPFFPSLVLGAKIDSPATSN